MGNIVQQAEAKRILDRIESKYDIFFAVKNMRITDVFELQFLPQATLKQKENMRIPRSLVNELRQDFDIIETGRLA